MSGIWYFSLLSTVTTDAIANYFSCFIENTSGDTCSPCVYGFSYEDLPPYRQLGSFSFKDPFFPDAGSAAIPGWEIKGSTVVMQDFVRLTSAENGRSGWITNRRPFFMETVNITLSFHVHSSNKNGGDGIALWLSESPLKPGPVFAAAETWTGVAIIMDTWSNSGQDSVPQIAVHYNDGKKSYSVANDGADTLLRKCSANYRNSEISYLNVVIYDNLLTVTVAPYGDGSWSDCVQNYYVEMPNRYFFSISAMTGGLSDNHDIKSFQVGTHDVAGDKKERTKRDNEPGNNAVGPTKNIDPTINNENNNDDSKTVKNQIANNDVNTDNVNNNQNIDISNNNANNLNIKDGTNYNNANNNINNAAKDDTPLVLSHDFLDKETQRKKELMDHFPNQEFWDQVQDDDEDIMGKIRNMKEQFGHQLLQLQFSFRDQIEEIKADIPSALSIYNDLKEDIIKIEETLSKSGTIVTMIHKEIASLTAEPEVSKEVESVMNIVGNRLKNLDTTLQKMNNLINKVQNEQRAQLDAEKAEKQKNEGGSIFPALIIIVIVLVVVAVIAKYLCFSSKKIKKEGIL